MAYYPKNKIKTNLFTSGGEYQTSLMALLNSSPPITYNGYYYKLADGKTYKGKYPGDGDNEEIFSLTNAPTATPPPPKTSVPPLYPTPEDYKTGYFTRYFKKKINEFLFEELTLDQYNIVYTVLYIPFSIQWKLTGIDIDEVYTINKNTSLLTEQRYKVNGFNEYLNNDYARYYK
jgi:hypothetical protein